MFNKISALELNGEPEFKQEQPRYASNLGSYSNQKSGRKLEAMNIESLRVSITNTKRYSMMMST